MTTNYRIPAETHRSESTVSNSHFITSITYAPSVDEAKAFLSQIREEMSDASHHVYAFRVGYGNSVIEGMSDDGEPSGTAGPPVLSVLRGTDIGDIIIVVTRYFGGTKLGTGGLVRAYSEAARTALNTLPTEIKIEKRTLGIECPYPFYEQVKRLVHQHGGTIEDEDFAAEVLLVAVFPVDRIAAFVSEISELTAGNVVPVPLDT